MAPFCQVVHELNVEYNFSWRNQDTGNYFHSINQDGQKRRPSLVCRRLQELFDRFLDKARGGAKKLAAALAVTLADLLPVRLVSHHMQLLGVLARKDDTDWLVLVDCDRSE